jgi:hypothetical protein
VVAPPRRIRVAYRKPAAPGDGHGGGDRCLRLTQGRMTSSCVGGRLEDALRFVAEDRHELQTFFQFELVDHRGRRADNFL